MARQAAHSPSNVVPLFPHETLDVGIDVGKFRHVAGFLSRTLLKRHERFEGCPTFVFDQSREGFRAFLDRLRELVPLEQVSILLVMYNPKSSPWRPFLRPFLQAAAQCSTPSQGQDERARFPPALPPARP
jgi:hypothetical protein